MVLKAKQIKHAKEGMHADGGGLYLRVQVSGSKSWIFRFQLKGKRREMGMGTLDAKSPPDARAEAAQYTAQVRAGVDPIEARAALAALEQQRLEQQRREEDSGDTFKAVAAEYIKAKSPGGKNDKHADQWTNTLAAYAEPFIGHIKVSQITTDHVLEILKDIWTTKTETASRVRSRIELVLTYAKARKMRQGENPAVWRGNLDALLPKPTAVQEVQHHPALPYTRIAEFITALHGVTGTGAKALELAILTATESFAARPPLHTPMHIEC